MSTWNDLVRKCYQNLQTRDESPDLVQMIVLTEAEENEITEIDNAIKEVIRQRDQLILDLRNVISPQ